MLKYTDTPARLHKVYHMQFDFLTNLRASITLYIPNIYKLYNSSPMFRMPHCINLPNIPEYSHPFWDTTMLPLCIEHISLVLKTPADTPLAGVWKTG